MDDLGDEGKRDCLGNNQAREIGVSCVLMVRERNLGMACPNGSNN